MRKRKTMDFSNCIDKNYRRKEQKLDQEEDSIDVDEETLQLQELLCEYFDSNKKSSSPVDVKKNGVDKSCPTKDIHELSFWSSEFEEGESSCTFCVICDDAKPSTSMKRSEGCGHYFCKDCIENYIGEKIQEDVMEIKCPGKNCGRVLDEKLCESFIPDDLIDYFQQSRCEVRALSWPKAQQCPYPFCSESFLDDKRKLPIIACPNCWKLICVHCWVPYHEGLNCKEYQERLQLSDEDPVFIIYFVRQVEN